MYDLDKPIHSVKPETQSCGRFIGWHLLCLGKENVEGCNKASCDNRWKTLRDHWHIIMLLTEEYLPNPDASGVCAHNLAKEIVHRGNTVTILCRRKYHLPKVETIEGVDVYGIYRTALLDKNNRSLLPRLFRRLSFILHLPLYPIKSLSYLVRMIQPRQESYRRLV
jgi:hypothetical protein